MNPKSSAPRGLLAAIHDLEAKHAAREPQVLAFLPDTGRFERLRREAEALLRRYPNPAERPPLFGLPIGVKDIFHVDGYVTRAGCRLPEEELQGNESIAVRTMRSAGALILGKTVTTEFAYFAPGPTHNPHRHGHTPGGSSSGSAAAVGARMCPVALGTQTIGSISRPAAYCGVVGYKPSYDRIHRSGVIPLAPSLDHVGLFAYNVALAERAARVIAAGWIPATADKRPVLAVPRGPILERAELEGRNHFDDTCRRLAGAGFEVRLVSAFTDLEQIEERHMLLVAAEAARTHAIWFKRYGHLYRPKTAELLERGMEIHDADRLEARAGREDLRKQLSTVMKAQGIDLWISPGAPGPAPEGLDDTGSPSMSLPWTYSGLPTLTVPSGRSEDGLPMGLQLTADWWADERLFRWGKEIAAALA